MKKREINNKNKRGITLLAIVITMLVLIILASTTIYFGYRALNISHNTKIYSNLKLLREQLELANDKHTFSGDALPGNNLTNSDKVYLTNKAHIVAEGDNFWDKWRRLDKGALKSLGLPERIIEGDDMKIYVDYNTKEVVSTQGYIKSDGTKEYRLTEMEKMAKDE